MTAYEVVEARASDCGQMARRLRGEHAEALVRIGVNAHRDLRGCFDQSSFRRAWRADGKLVGLGGITGTLSNLSGIVWLAFTEEARKHKRALLATAKIELVKAMLSRRTLVTLILTHDQASFRFAQHLGFVVSVEATDHFESVLMTYEGSGLTHN